MLEDGNATCEYSQKIRERTDSPLRKCARIFLTGETGVADVDFRGHGRVLEDGNITCEYSLKLRERTGNPNGTVCEVSSPRQPVSSTLTYVALSVCWKTAMSLERTFAETRWEWQLVTSLGSFVETYQ